MEYVRLEHSCPILVRVVPGRVRKTLQKTMRRAPKFAIPCALARLSAFSRSPRPSAFRLRDPHFRGGGQKGRLFGHFGPARAPSVPLVALKLASRLGFRPFLRRAPSRPFEARARLVRAGSRSTRSGSGFIAIYGTSARYPPKPAKTHGFLACFRGASSERSYPRDWSAGRVRPVGGVAGRAPALRAITAVCCDFGGRKGAKMAGIDGTSLDLYRRPPDRIYGPGTPSVMRTRTRPVRLCARYRFLATLPIKI